MELIVSKVVLFVTNDFGPRAGGIESFVIGLIERRDFGTTIVYTSSQADSSEYDDVWTRDYGVRIIRDTAKILLPTPRVARKLSRIIKEEQITVAAFGAAAPLGLLSASMKRAGVKKTVALTHGHEVWWAGLFPFNLLIKRIGSTVDTLTYLGDFTGSRIRRALTEASKAAMVRVAPGIDVEHFTPQNSDQLRSKLGLDGKKVIISVGRLVHRKGQDQLILAMPDVLQEVPEAHLLIIGEGPYRAHLDSLIKKLKLHNHVTFIGRVAHKDLPQYMCVGHIFAMPSRSRFFGLEVEGLGIVYLEASACGLAVIAGSSGGAPDAVVSGVTGQVVDGTKGVEIAAAVKALLKNPDKARSMGMAGRQWIDDQWRWQRWSNEFNRLLR